MCKNWSPEAFYVKTDQDFQAAILIFFQEGSIKIEFLLAYRRDEKDSIEWTKKSPNKRDVTFSLSEFPAHLRFATLRPALDHVLRRNGRQDNA
jgi:hypothetical protein